MQGIVTLNTAYNYQTWDPETAVSGGQTVLCQEGATLMAYAPRNLKTNHILHSPQHPIAHTFVFFIFIWTRWFVIKLEFYTL